MKTLLKKFITTFSAIALLVAPQVALVPSVAHAQDISQQVCEGVTLNASGTCAADESQTNFNTLITRIINIFSIVVGAVSVIMIIIGGFRYIVSGGDSNSVSGAKNTLLYAIVGLVIVLFAQIIVRFVLSTATQPAP